MKRPTVNITPLERAGRVGIGLVVVVGGTLLLASTGWFEPVILLALLVLAGLGSIVTGAVGHCPLYARLHHTPSSSRRA